VIGRLAAEANLGDRGSSDTRPRPDSVVTPLDGLRSADPSLRVVFADGGDPRAAAAVAAGCEAALVVAGLDWRLEGEHIHPGDIAPILRQTPPPDWLLRLFGRQRLKPFWSPVAGLMAWITGFASAREGGDFAAGDRTTLGLPPEQVALIRAVAAANPRTVVALMGGGAILCEEWRDLVPGLLMLWYPGQRGGEALADVLLGRVSPSGRLPFAVPTREDHLPPFEPRAPRVTYDLWHGYRRLGRDGHPAAFPFGFGLSYSRFEATDPEAALHGGDGGNARVAVRVSVGNAGPMEADEVVQVYLEPPGGPLERPARTLVAFRRLTLKPGQTERITLGIPLRRLACFDPGRDAFVVEAGVHRFVVARHAEDGGVAVDLALAERVVGC
jgi:beta-glucosidase